MSGGLGPQIRFLDALFVRAAALTPEDVEAFADAWYLGEWPRHRIDDWRGAWNRTTTAISEAGRDGGWLIIRDQFGEVDTKDVWEDDESLPWEVAMSAARDAAVGVLSRDRVEPRDYDELTMGWRCLIGPAPTPTTRIRVRADVRSSRRPRTSVARAALAGTKPLS